MTAPTLLLDRLGKQFGAQAVLSDLTLELAAGEILALLGPSGSGKTTALRLVAGFETPDRGRVVVGGEDVTRVAPAKRRFGMVFQHYALFPHLDVERNVAFGLAGLSHGEQRSRVGEALELVGLGALGSRRVDELSGGQQQRVALARALAPRPRVLLLDEPMSNLDPTLRERTRRELVATLRQVGITTLLVTHEQDEAFALGDRVAVLHGGRLAQVDTPRGLYGRPADRFVATFVGRASILPARWLAAPSALSSATPGRADSEPAMDIALDLAGGTTPPVVWSARCPATTHQPRLGDAVDVVVRPEGLALTDRGSGLLPATVRDARFLGAATLATVTVELASGVWPVEVLCDATTSLRSGDEVALTPRGPWPPLVFVAQPGSLTHAAS